MSFTKNITGDHNTVYNTWNNNGTWARGAFYDYSGYVFKYSNNDTDNVGGVGFDAKK